MAGINKVILIGNLGGDPEVRTLETGVKMCRFSLATSESYKDKEGKRIDQTEWHKIVLWRGLAEIAEKFLKKGNTIYLEGKLTTRKYNDKDNVERWVTEIVGNSMTMLGGPRRPGETEEPSMTVEATQAAESNPTPDDDLPF